MVVGDGLPRELHDEVLEAYNLPFEAFSRVEIRRDSRSGKIYGHVYNHGIMGNFLCDTVEQARAEVSNRVLSLVNRQRKELLKKLVEIDSVIPDVSPANMACGDWMKQYQSPTKTGDQTSEGGN